MVYGLDKFKEYFDGHLDKYVLIGGSACDVLLDDLGADFRATKDLDIVLIIEAINVSFGELFWDFINVGEYAEKLSSENKFYRFSKPINKAFPKMIELFTREPLNFKLKNENGLRPVHVDEEVKSLSAILLDDNYYDIARKYRTNISGVSVLSMEAVILFKIKAYNDMISRKNMGQKIDSRDFKKHKNDVFRLLMYVDISKNMNLKNEVKQDVLEFLERISNDRPDLKNLGIGVKYESILEIINSVFLS